MNKNTTQKQFEALIKLQLVNLYGMNVYRNLKDPKEKKKKFWLGVAYAFVIIVMMSYVGGLTFGYVYIGLADILPAYLIMIASLVILMFSVFKAGDIIFQKNSYDILSSLPVRNSSIVISRFIRMYVENLLLTLVVMLPAIVVFGVLVKPAWSFYVLGLIVTTFIPLFPITISVFVGALIMAVSSRSKHKNLVSILLSVVLIVAIMLGSMQLSTVEENIDVEAIQNMLHMVLDIINSIYPPAVWLGQAMLTGDFLLCIVCVGAGSFVFAIVMWLVSANYKWISTGLYSTSAKHDYKMENLEKTHMLGALYKREFKRYFASSVYVTNTIVSPIMGMLFAVAMFFVGPEQLDSVAAEFYAESGMMLQIRNMLPMALAMIFCMMPITAVSISMEGKQWWIVKTLPIRAKDLLDSKLLMNLSVIGPFYFLSVILISIGQRVSPMEFVWILFVPLVAMLFSCVFGQTVNLKMAVFDWENEVSIVKQSASAFVGGIVPFFVMIPIMFGAMLIPMQYKNLCMLMFCLVVGAVTVILYKKNSEVDLINI
ncbi:MAG: hypothetical protein IJO60_11345 [Agathobacter sp.]|nr:hypothetical protein [Agathobacter sp.]